MQVKKIFIVDDEEIIRVSTADELRDEGFDVYEYSSAEAALEAISRIEPDVIFTDIRMPGMNGVDFLKKIKQINKEIIVILMTAYGSINDAVQSIKEGAYDYLTKPFQNEEITLLLERINELKSLKNYSNHFREEISGKFNIESLVGESTAIKEVIEQIEIVSQSNITALITGDTGTGKELVANIIHQLSDRRDKPLVKVHCATLSQEIIESELFGHERGSFTGAFKTKIGRFELSDKGSIYLDDVDDIPLDIQVKLLRVLQEKEIERVGATETIKVDVRIIASTKTDLSELVKLGKFRDDLYYRLKVFPIYLHPLKHRSEDIPNLVNNFISEFSPNRVLTLDSEVINDLKKYSWPGNIRELKNVVERLVLLAKSGKILHETLPKEVISSSKDVSEIIDKHSKDLNQILEEVEIDLIKKALEQTSGNKAKAAEILGIPPSTLRTKVDKYRINDIL